MAHSNSDRVVVCRSVFGKERKDKLTCFGPLRADGHEILLEEDGVAYGRIEHAVVPKFARLPYLWAIAVHGGVPEVKGRDKSGITWKLSNQ